MRPFLLIGISTANRAPRPNYVGTTLRALAAQGVPADQVHVFATDPDVAWLHTEAAGVAYTLHVPDRQLTRNENGIALLTEIPRCEWVLHLEDDLAICRDFVPSVVAWLEAHARLDRRGYFFHTPWCDRTRVQGSAWDYPIRRSNWIQAVALRHQDAEDFARWAQARLATWRRSRPPRWRFSGFDELLKEWALLRYPHIRYWLASYPSFVQHVGDISLVHHPRSKRRNATFPGEHWSYVQ